MGHARRPAKVSSARAATSKISIDKGQRALYSSLLKRNKDSLIRTVINIREELKINRLNMTNLQTKVSPLGGHPAFNDLMLDQMQLHAIKNKGYAAGGAPLGNFERSAAIMALYPNIKMSRKEVVAMSFVLKHFDAIMWSLNIGRNAPDESLVDISVYMTIIRCMNKDYEGKPMSDLTIGGPSYQNTNAANVVRLKVDEM